MKKLDSSKKISTAGKLLIAAARELSAQVGRLKFKPPVTHIYNPLGYAWAAHELYLQKFGGGKKRVVFLGMNPGLSIGASIFIQSRTAAISPKGIPVCAMPNGPGFMPRKTTRFLPPPNLCRYSSCAAQA